MDARKISALSEAEMIALKQQNKTRHAAVRDETRQRVSRAQAHLQKSALLLNSATIETLTRKMADNIVLHLHGTAPLVLTLYSEGVHFSNHLTEKLGNRNLTLEENYLDFSMDNATPQLRLEPTADLNGRTILLVDAALKDGKKMQCALDYCASKGARAVYCAVLIDMPGARAPWHKDLKPSFYGCVCANHSLIGFGFDADGFFRNEPQIYMEPPLSAAASTHKSSTVTIRSSMMQARRNLHPLVLNTRNPANQTALLKAQQAEQSFNKLEQLYTGEQITAQMRLTAEELKAKLQNENPVVLAMQKGGSHFTTHLTELLCGIPLEESYMHITRYGDSKTGSNAQILAAPAVDVKGRIVVISEDLIEGGLTMQLAVSLCLERGATEVYLVVLGDKPQKRLQGLGFIKADFCCFQFDNRFLTGCGLDEKGYFRNKYGVWVPPLQDLAQKTEAPRAPTTALVAASQPAKKDPVSAFHTKMTLGRFLTLSALVAGSFFAVKYLLRANKDTTPDTHASPQPHL